MIRRHSVTGQVLVEDQDTCLVLRKDRRYYQDLRTRADLSRRPDDVDQGANACHPQALTAPSFWQES